MALWIVYISMRFSSFSPGRHRTTTPSSTTRLRLRLRLRFISITAILQLRTPLVILIIIHINSHPRPQEQRIPRIQALAAGARVPCVVIVVVGFILGLEETVGVVGVGGGVVADGEEWCVCGWRGDVGEDGGVLLGWKVSWGVCRIGRRGKGTMGIERRDMARDGVLRRVSVSLL